MAHEAGTLLTLIEDHMEGAILVVIKNIIRIDLLQQVVWRLICLASKVLVGSTEKKLLDDALVVLEPVRVLTRAHHSYVQWGLAEKVLCINICPVLYQKLYVLDLLLQDSKM